MCLFRSLSLLLLSFDFGEFAFTRSNVRRILVLFSLFRSGQFSIYTNFIFRNFRDSTASRLLKPRAMECITSVLLLLVLGKLKSMLAVTKKPFSYICSKETDVMHYNLHQILTFPNTENLK